MPKSWTELKAQRLGAMSAAERVEYDRAYAAAALAAEVGERVREAGRLPGSANGSWHDEWERARRQWTGWRPAASGRR